MPDNKKILVGTPDQSAVTGAIKRAAAGTAVTGATVKLEEGWTSGGYVDEDGVTISPDLSTSEIRDWKKSLQRKLVDNFDGSISFTYLEFGDEESLKQTFGDDYVTKSESELKVALGAHLGEVQAWAIDVKDGDTAVRVYVPRGQVTEYGDISLVAGEAIKCETTLSCYDDGTGNSIYIFINGSVVTGATPQEANA